MDKIKQLIELRQEQATLKLVIAALEQDIIKEVPNQKLEGTTKTEWGSVTNKLSRKIDIDIYQKGISQIPAKYHFVEFTPKIDLKKLRAAEGEHHKFVADCITVKPAKAVLKIKAVE